MAFREFGNNNSSKRFQKPIPVKEGQTHEVTIESIGEKGDGIAKIEGYVIIVPNTKKGERVKIKVNAVRGKVSFGEVIERLGEGSVKEDKEDGEMSEDEDEMSDDEDNEEEDEEEDLEEEPEEVTEEEN